MGIRNLNKYLLNHCSKNSIEKVHISIIKDQVIVIDTSIYLDKIFELNQLSIYGVLCVSKAFLSSALLQ